MKKSLSAGIVATIGLAAAIAAPTASATNLSITTGTHSCLIGADASHWTGCSFGAAATTGGSYFNMGGSFANDISSSVGLNVGVGTAQPFVGTAPMGGAPLSGTTAGNISDTWTYFSLTQFGVNYSLSDVILTDTGAGTASADMSGWRVAWSEVPNIDMGAGAPGDFTYDGTNWTLDYSAVVPAGDASGFGGTAYALHLEGTYTGAIEIAPSAVPVPAAVWLFGSGLLGLVGVARRKASV